MKSSSSISRKNTQTQNVQETAQKMAQLLILTVSRTVIDAARSPKFQKNFFLQKIVAKLLIEWQFAYASQTPFVFSQPLPRIAISGRNRRALTRKANLSATMCHILGDAEKKQDSSGNTTEHAVALTLTNHTVSRDRSSSTRPRRSSRLLQGS